MELRDFAEAILFAGDIDGKLLAPASMEDERPGSVMAVPAFPRHQDVEGSEFLLPRRHQLDRDATRGRLLLRLADHELLALELMALALLRFPEAPGSFRRDLFATMRDEQRHLKLYLDRAGQLGV
ncbi:MAG: DUF455 family protein, partial [Planctomycetes bacterium]|nr:DUF455 family protein [Planctomycetota bacterium]